MIEEKQAGHIGYAYQEIVYNDDMQNSNACFAVDSFISKYFLFQARGDRLSFQNGNNEVILYGRMLEEHYKIGDMVSLNGVGYKVVGILPYYEPVWGMYSSVSESDTDVLMYALNENMYFINNEKAFQQGNTRLRSVLFAKDDIPGLPGKASMKKIKQKVTEYKKRKQVFGITFEQGRNELEVNEELLSHVVTDQREIPKEALMDMKIALITLKYTQSNSVCFVKDGQAIGIGAG